jgi:hypothetical protein
MQNVRTFAKFRDRESLFPTPHSIVYSIEHIKLKLLLFSKFYSNFGKISLNLCEISYPTYSSLAADTFFFISRLALSDTCTWKTFFV